MIAAYRLTVRDEGATLWFRADWVIAGQRYQRVEVYPRRLATEAANGSLFARGLGYLHARIAADAGSGAQLVGLGLEGPQDWCTTADRACIAAVLASLRAHRARTPPSAGSA